MAALLRGLERAHPTKGHWQRAPAWRLRRGHSYRQTGWPVCRGEVGPLAHPQAVLVWQASVLRSIPTEADTTQKTTPLSAGSIAIADKTFLTSWTHLTFPGGQSGWVRSEGLIRLYR